MIRIMLVDDEPFIRVAIKTLFPWEDHGFQIVSEAGNGEAAILKLEYEPVDLIITDIKMPIRDGIQLIHYVKQYYPQILCVVLSNYEDFNLTRNAFMEGAVDYLLKSDLNKENFSALVSRLKNNYFSMNPPVAAPPVPVLNSEEKLTDIFRKLAEGETVSEEEVHLLRPESSYLISSIKLEGYSAHSMSSSAPNENLIKNTVMKIISEISEFKLYNYSKSTKEYLLMIYRDEQDLPVFYSRLRAFFSSLINNIKIYLNNFTVIGSSRLHYNVSEIPTACREADRCSDSIFYRRDSVVCFCQETKEKTSPVKEFVLSRIDSITFFLKDQDWQKLSIFFHELLDLFQKTNYPSLQAKRLITNLEFLIASEITRLSGKEAGFLFHSESIHESTEQANHIDALVVAVEAFLEDLKKGSGHAPTPVLEYSLIVQQALSYLTQNYTHPDTNLGTVAYAISVNSSYLSRLFYKETKQHFNEYLTSLRLDYAKRLLLSTQDSIAEIAEKCGYNNAKYFINSFKKIQGTTPSSFRSQNSGSYGL